MTRISRIVCAALLLLATGCVVREHVVVRTPPVPPPSQVEIVPVRPGPAHVWVPGHWAWRGSERGYVWVGGHWAVPQGSNYVWMPGHWAQESGGYVWVEGHWRSR